MSFGQPGVLVTRRFLWNRGRPRLSRWRSSSGFRPCELPTGNSHFRRWDHDINRQMIVAKFILFG